MNFLEKLDYMMQKLSLNKSKLSQLSGVPYTTIDAFYKKGYENTKISTIRKIASALNVSLDYLVDDNIFDESYQPPKMKEAPSELPEEALKVAKDYHGLDRHGKTMTRMVISEEQKRMEEEAARRREKELYMDEGDEFTEPADVRVIPLYFTPAAAGYASPAFGEDFDYLEIGGEVPKAADFAVRIDGDSMEPYIMDGSIAYVNRDPLADGDVGIFSLDGDMLCKQYHKDKEGMVHLYSLNRERADADRHITPDCGSTLACFGRVILPHRVNLPTL